ncbi:MAG: hypothetical protein H5T34_00295 [Candidatus Methanomethyliales bacterium]|nr:hypothetical protein [Candidatus Methanomethylicales archaeon]
MGIIYENLRKVGFGGHRWCEIYEFIDTGCAAGCTFMVEITLKWKEPITDKERAEEIRSLREGISELEGRLVDLKSIVKPDFKALQRAVSSTKTGTREHEEALRKLKGAHRRWAELKRMIQENQQIKNRSRG